MCWQHWGQIDAAPEPSSCVLTQLPCENVSLASFTECCAPGPIWKSLLGDIGQVHQPHYPQMSCKSKMEKHIQPLAEKWGKSGRKDICRKNPAKSIYGRKLQRRRKITFLGTFKISHDSFADKNTCEEKFHTAGRWQEDQVIYYHLYILWHLFGLF